MTASASNTPQVNGTDGGRDVAQEIRRRLGLDTPWIDAILDLAHLFGRVTDISPRPEA